MFQPDGRHRHEFSGQEPGPGSLRSEKPLRAEGIHGARNLALSLLGVQHPAETGTPADANRPETRSGLRDTEEERGPLRSPDEHREQVPGSRCSGDRSSGYLPSAAIAASTEEPEELQVQEETVPEKQAEEEEQAEEEQQGGLPVQEEIAAQATEEEEVPVRRPRE